MQQDEVYQKKKKSAIKNLKYFIIFNVLFAIFNIVVIYLVDGYSFPKNFFAIWSILGWGIPTLAKFIQLTHYKHA